MKPMPRDVKGSTTLEFALVSTILMMMIFGSVELGLWMWTRGTLQAIAAQTARCAAINSPICYNSTTTPPTTPQSYAAAQATAMLIPVSTVNVTSGTGCLSETAGTTIFEVVTITATAGVGVRASGLLAKALGPITETVTACYPT